MIKSTSRLMFSNIVKFKNLSIIICEIKAVRIPRLRSGGTAGALNSVFVNKIAYLKPFVPMEHHLMVRVEGYERQKNRSDFSPLNFFSTLQITEQHVLG